MKLIDKSALVAEMESKIKKLLFNLKICKTENDRKTINLYIGCYNGILSFIDTLETKDVDFIKELDKEWNKCEPIDEGMGLEIASIEHGQFDNIAKHFFELGLKARKEEVK